MSEMFSRRDFLKKTALIGFGGSVGLIGGVAEAGQANSKGFFTRIIEPQTLSFVNMHTGEKFHEPYKRGHVYIPEALEKLSYVMRDHRTGDVHWIDKDLLDYLHSLKKHVDSKDQMAVLSGYRSPKTNEMLRKKSDGVAKHSYHTIGRAVDISLPGYSSQALHRAAIDLKLGGAGFYKTSGFVHLDTGPVRHW